MTDFFLQIGLSNACFALALAMVAMVVGAKARRPHLAYMLWLLVFIKLVTPPIVPIPVGIFSVQSDNVVAGNDNSPAAAQLPIIGEFVVDVAPAISETGQASSLFSSILTMSHRAKPWLAGIWLLGSAVVFGWSMIRVFRFGRLLAAESEAASQELQTAAAKIARRLGLRRIPTIYTTSTRLSPLVWWAGGKVRIVIPTALLDRMDTRQLQWVLAHELAHVRRRDYLVRWLEWLACVCFWWNPVVWWAQRNLRATEEICCDALVLCSMHPKPQSYANSILTAVESLACPTLRPPAVASEINSGGFLERRFKMIVSSNPNRSRSRWLQVCVLLCAIVVLPLGIASARRGGSAASDRDIEAQIAAVEARIKAAIEAGDMTEEEGKARLIAFGESLARKMEAEENRRTVIAAIAAKIRAAVEAGEITEEEGRAKLTGLRQRMAPRTRGEGERDPRAEYAAAEERIRGAIEAGKISEEDGRARLAGLRQRLAQRDRGERDPRAELAAAGERIRAAVAAGEITAEEGRIRLNGLKERLSQRGSDDRGRDLRAEYAGAARRIEAAVEAGRMTPEVAAAWLEGYKRGLGMRDRGDDRPDWEGIKRRIEAAVESGQMTREEADAKYKEIRLRMAGQADRSAKTISREDYAAAAEKIRKAIAEGKITEEQGRERLAAMRKMIGENTERPTRKRTRDGDTRKDVDWASIKKRFEGAVASGRMTREEADAQYKAIRERMAGREDIAPKRTRERQGVAPVSREERLRIWQSMTEAERTRLRQEAIQRMSGERSEGGGERPGSPAGEAPARAPAGQR